jgi:hypothetical protein
MSKIYNNIQYIWALLAPGKLTFLGEHRISGKSWKEIIKTIKYYRRF